MPMKRAFMMAPLPPHCPLPTYKPVQVKPAPAVVGSTPNLNGRRLSSSHGRHLNNGLIRIAPEPTIKGKRIDSLDDLHRGGRIESRQSRNSVSSTGSINADSAPHLNLQKRGSRSSIASSIVSRPISAESELFRKRSTSSYSSNGELPARNTRIVQVLSNSDIRSRSANIDNGAKDGSLLGDMNGEVKKNGINGTHSPHLPLSRQNSNADSPKRSSRPRSQYIGDTVWQVDDTVFCGGMESVMNQNLLCRLQIEYVVDLTGLDEEHLPRNRRTECPCLCARKTQHSRMTMAISIYDDDRQDSRRQDFISFFEDFMNLISRAKACGKCVLVHSVKGRNRAPAFIAAYLMHNTHITRVQAVSKVGEMMSRMRPGLQISDTLQRALMRWQTALGIRSNDTSNNLEQQLAVPLFTIKRTAWT